MAMIIAVAVPAGPKSGGAVIMNTSAPEVSSEGAVASRKLRAESAHEAEKIREARRDECAVVDRDRLSARKAHHQERHGDAMVHVGGDGAAARHGALAVHDEIVALDRNLGAVRDEPRGGRGEP